MIATRLNDFWWVIGWGLSEFCRLVLIPKKSQWHSCDSLAFAEKAARRQKNIKIPAIKPGFSEDLDTTLDM